MGVAASKLPNFESIEESGLNTCINQDLGCGQTDVVRKIRCVVRWTYGGEEVFVVGSFNSWKKLDEYKLFKSGHDHVIVIELTKDIHYYKFIVDEEWRYSPENPIKSDEQGFVNNYIDLRSYHPPLYIIPNEYDQIRFQKFHQKFPSEFPADAPALPILLGKSKCPLESMNSIHIPFHCISNHIYYDSLIQDVFGANLVTFCVTKRWRGLNYQIKKNESPPKYTTILYATFRKSNDDFHPIVVCKKNECKEHRGSNSFLNSEREYITDNIYSSLRLITTTEMLASIFRFQNT